MSFYIQGQLCHFIFRFYGVVLGSQDKDVIRYIYRGMIVIVHGYISESIGFSFI